MPSIPPAIQLALPSEQTKRCPKCEQTKPLDDFALALQRKGHRAGWCRVCTNRANRECPTPRRRQSDPVARQRENRLAGERRARNAAGLPPRPRRLTTEVHTPAPEPLLIPPNLRRRGQWLRLAYGVTVQQYEIMWIAQRGLCAICQCPETRVSKSGEVAPLSVDHCYTTGIVRGLLCSACNIGIGNLRHNPDYLERAATYLRKNPD
jgi:hypothetical protein